MTARRITAERRRRTLFLNFGGRSILGNAMAAAPAPHRSALKQDVGQRETL